MGSCEFLKLLILHGKISTRGDFMTDKAKVRGDQYIVCRTCGKYTLLAEAYNTVYCSPVCTVNYSQCIICHRYVEKDQLFQEHYCSPECAVHYQFLRTMGPKPVVLKSEEFPHENGDVIL